MYWLLTVIIILIFVWASADVGSGIYLKVLCRRQTEKPYVALTFDDGPDEVMTPRILNVLNKYKIKAAFFLVGEKVRKYPDVVQRIVREGHIVGNHTYSHSIAFTLSDTCSVLKDIEAAQQAVEDVAGIQMQLFRPPFGVTNPIIGNAVRRCGLQAVGWSIRSLDTFEKIERNTVCKRIKRKLHNGAVILLHERCKDSDVLLEYILREIESCNMQIVMLDQLFDIKI